MTPAPSPAEQQEFDSQMARGGLKVPAAWRAGALAGYLDLRASAELLREDLPADLEPSNVFDPSRLVP